MRLTTPCTLVTLVPFAFAQEVIIDNTDPEFSLPLNPGGDEWNTGSFAGGWPGASGDYRWAFTTGSAGPATHIAEWRPTLPSAGSWEVAVWYNQGANRATDAPYTVTYDGGSATIDVNQEANGSSWFTLGTWPFQAGTTGSVTLSNAAEDASQAGSNQVVIADAARFRVPTGPPPPGADEIRGVWSSRFQ